MPWPSTSGSSCQHSLGEAYRIERELGGGGMSRVFLALETSLQRKVVVKVLLPELAAGRERRAVPPRDLPRRPAPASPHRSPPLRRRVGGLPYFTMPYVDGESLRARLLRERELPVPQAVRVLRDVASALAYAHAQGVVHRDIKPDNVLLSHGVAVVTDFGVAKALTVSSGPDAARRTRAHLAGHHPRHPVLHGAGAGAADPAMDHRVDIYAFGVTAYEMLTGEPPFTGPSPHAILGAHLAGMPEPHRLPPPGHAAAAGPPDHEVPGEAARRPAAERGRDHQRPRHRSPRRAAHGADRDAAAAPAGQRGRTRCPPACGGSPYPGGGAASSPASRRCCCGPAGRKPPAEPCQTASLAASAGSDPGAGRGPAAPAAPTRRPRRMPSPPSPPAPARLPARAVPRPSSRRRRTRCCWSGFGRRPRAPAARAVRAGSTTRSSPGGTRASRGPSRWRRAAHRRGGRAAFHRRGALVLRRGAPRDAACRRPAPPPVPAPARLRRGTPCLRRRRGSDPADPGARSPSTGRRSSRAAWTRSGGPTPGCCRHRRTSGRSSSAA